jgi:hypothetical protein
MAGAPKGNKNAKGNKGGTSASKYHKSFPGVAKKLCELGATNADLAIAFNVVLSTIWNWQVSHVEFNESCKVGIAQSLSPFRDLAPKALHLIKLARSAVRGRHGLD